ncbi:MAG: leucine-rich repeat protein [Ruminococcus sp.]
MKKLISILLTLCIVVSICSVSVVSFNADSSSYYVTSEDGLWSYLVDKGNSNAYYDPNTGILMNGGYYDNYLIHEYFGTEKKLTLPTELDGHKINGIMSLTGNIKEITVPVTYDYIEAQAFTQCVGLEKVVFSDQYTKPFNNFSFAFYNCKSLKEVVMPNVLGDYQWTNHNDYYLPGGLFEKCSKLTKVTFPESLTVESVNMCCFKGCKSLKTITLPKGVKYIEESAFENCTSLESIELPDTTVGIRMSTFRGCTGLKTVKLPASFKEINFNAEIDAERINDTFGTNTTFEAPYNSPILSALEDTKRLTKVVYPNIFDVNNDGEVTVLDVSIIQKYLGKVIELDAVPDVNEDEVVNIDDVTHLQRILCSIF